MKDAEIVAKLNELLSHSETSTGGFSFNDAKPCVVKFSHRVEEIQEYISFRILEEHANLYLETFRAIFNKGELKNKYTIKNVESEFHSYLFELKIKNISANLSNFVKFFNKLNMAPKTKVLVLHPIYGLDITNENPINAGCFTFYNYSLHKQCLLELYGFDSEENFLEHFSEFGKRETWLSVEVEAVTVDKAYEIAYSHFEVLQGICQFIFDIEGYNAHAVCILNDVRLIHDRCYVLSEFNILDKSSSDIRRFKNINIYNLINDTYNLFTSLINSLFTNEKSEVLNRIKNAFTTYGRTLHEYSDAQKFAMYITTIESLIEYDSRELTELISRYLSCVISNTAELYEEIKSDFKFIYNLRSEILHGSRVYVMKGDLMYAKNYACTLIKKMVTDKEIFSIKKDKDLRIYLDNKVRELEEQNV